MKGIYVKGCVCGWCETTKICKNMHIFPPFYLAPGLVWLLYYLVFAFNTPIQQHLRFRLYQNTNINNLKYQYHTPVCKSNVGVPIRNKSRYSCGIGSKMKAYNLIKYKNKNL